MKKNLPLAVLFTILLLAACANSAATIPDTPGIPSDTSGNGGICNEGTEPETFPGPAQQSPPDNPAFTDPTDNPAQAPAGRPAIMLPSEAIRETWQEAYAQLLREYAPLLITDDNKPSGYFLLHDIKGDGVPQLIIFEKHIPQCRYRWCRSICFGVSATCQCEYYLCRFIYFIHGVYTFENGRTVFLGNRFGYMPVIENIFTLPGATGIFTMAYGSSGPLYRHILLEENLLVISKTGNRFPSGEFWLLPAEERENYEEWDFAWWTLFVDDELVTPEEFEQVFGRINERDWLEFLPIPHHAQPEMFAESWQKAYAELLREYLTKPSPNEDLYHVHRAFMLYDIDKDGVPELMIFYMAAGFWLEAFYSYRNGEIIPVKVQTEGGFLIYYFRAYPTPDGRPGIIFADTLRHPDGPDAYIFDYWVLEGNTLVPAFNITRLFSDWVNCEVISRAGWFVRGEQVTEEEFIEVYNEFFRGWRERGTIWPKMLNESYIREIFICERD